MSDVVIRAEGLSKKYLIGHNDQAERYATFREVVTRTTKGLARSAREMLRGRQLVAGDQLEVFWALKDVNFEIKRGEVLGIIGRNGAGKSTLLKILSRITEPSAGRVEIKGRVASLLEVGTGFHPELSGRENIYLNGAILGMPRAEINQKFDEIVAFAEIERFLDTPVKRYSSGMYVRLAFAVAAHLEPEILVVDEVLAVGDAEFQKKCLGKIDQVSSRDGRTVVFVSHNMGVLTSLCPVAVWLDGGSIKMRGAARHVISEYLTRGAPSTDRVVRLDHLRRSVAKEEDRLRLESLEWISELPIRHGEPMKARIQFMTRIPISDVSIGIGFSSVEGKRLVTYETDFQDGFRSSLLVPGRHSVDVAIEMVPLAPDLYTLDIGCRSGDVHTLDYLPAALELEVIGGPNTPGYIVRKDAGVRLTSNWLWNLNAPTHAET